MDSTVPLQKRSPTLSIFDGLKLQHHLQRDRHIARVGARRGLVELGRTCTADCFLYLFEEIASAR